VATTPSVKIVKSMNFKGGVKLWSNRYHFNGGTPSSTSHWNTLNDAIVAAEKAIYPSHVTITNAVDYDAGSDVPVNSKSYSQAGTLTDMGQWTPPSEVAALIRYATTARTSKNHPIYLFNYYHGIYQNPSATNNDAVDSHEISAMDAYAAAWIAGFSDGTITAVRAGPNGATATGYLVEEYFTHRDFPYSRSA
jgi:hypothetical protein